MDTIESGKSEDLPDRTFPPVAKEPRRERLLRSISEALFFRWGAMSGCCTRHRQDDGPKGREAQSSSNLPRVNSRESLCEVQLNEKINGALIDIHVEHHG
jgi:hypothetical protein